MAQGKTWKRLYGKITDLLANVQSGSESLQMPFHFAYIDTIDLDFKNTRTTTTRWKHERRGLVLAHLRDGQDKRQSLGITARGHVLQDADCLMLIPRG
ncbi:hypothetical protein RRG08_061551 [Elysia crispata]|uniref:Uncharacterized protein n=1 Tax=Elysia crispata TaxID=231223 RepID=A0AAE1APL4_9GAST|nr:hypothetical protein RRG08_061551 [Elysia crispata]